jgi:hypothetical protein
VNSVIEDGRYTPLLLDESDRVDTFMQYAGGPPMDPIIVDCKKLMLCTQVQKTMTMEEAAEGLRQTVVNSLRHGKTMAFCLGNCALNIYKFDNASSFPVRSMCERMGRSMLESKTYEPLLRPDDLKPYGVFVPDPEFKVVFTSRFSEEDYYEFLENQIPMDCFLPIIVLPNETKPLSTTGVNTTTTIVPPPSLPSPIQRQSKIGIYDYIVENV